MARLSSTDDLRRIIAEPRPATRSKILDALDEQSIDFLKRCPFALVGTTAEDGTVEAVSVKDAKAFAVGVQWHPEYWAKSDEPSARIFQAFGDAVRAHRADRLGVRSAAE